MLLTHCPVLGQHILTKWFGVMQWWQYLPNADHTSLPGFYWCQNLATFAVPLHHSSSCFVELVPVVCRRLCVWSMELCHMLKQVLGLPLSKGGGVCLHLQLLALACCL